MTWVKLGDEFSDDADAAGLSDAAVRTHTDALVWSARRLLDLRVPKRDLARFAFSPDADAATKELETAGWWADDGDAWQLVYRSDWQQTRDVVERQREATRERQERSRRHRTGDHSMCIRGRYCPEGAVTREVTRDKRRESRHPDPSRPVPEEAGRDGDDQEVAVPDEKTGPPPLAAESIAAARATVNALRCPRHPAMHLRHGRCPLPTCDAMPSSAEATA